MRSVLVIYNDLPSWSLCSASPRFLFVNYTNQWTGLSYSHYFTGLFQRKHFVGRLSRYSTLLKIKFTNKQISQEISKEFLGLTCFFFIFFCCTFRWISIKILLFATSPKKFLWQKSERKIFHLLNLKIFLSLITLLEKTPRGLVTTYAGLAGWLGFLYHSIS